MKRCEKSVLASCCKNLKRTGSLAVLSAAVLASTGCKSLSWKPSGMFAWGGEPDPSEFEGTGGLQLPESPAAKHSPSAIASIGAESSSSPTTGLAQQSPYGYNSTQTTTPKAGLAAKANGYQTGPYQVGGAGSGTKTMNSVAGTTSSAGLPNPYGGPSSSSSSATLPDIPLPTGVTQTLNQAQQQVASQGYPSMPSNRIPATPVVGGTKPNVTLPTYPGPAGSGSAMPSYPKLPAVGTAGGTSPAPSAYQGASVGVGVGGAASSPSTGSAYQGTTTLGNPPSTAISPPSSEGGFAPGTTGRPNRYNFDSK